MKSTYLDSGTRPAPVLGGRRSDRRTHRRDIDGLRGLAIALVVIFHVFVGRVSAGVDVFLLIGGIFFFAPQIRNALNPDGLTPVQSVLRIVRRLYPALLTVVSLVMVLTPVIYPVSRWAQAGGDAASSLLYVQNLHLAAEGKEYSAVNRDVSLFQHIWSMSVQMQIYLGSLLVVVVLAALFRRRGRAGSRILHRTLSAATLLSFVYAVWLGIHDQAANYYSPLSRFWEIGLGGLFGIWMVGRGIPWVWRWLRWPAGVTGLVLIIATGLVLDGASQFPGPWTVVPLAGAMLVIVAGTPVTEPDGDRIRAAAEGRTIASVGVTRLLESRLFQFLGKTSYGLYLWHWPLLVLATYLFSESTGTQGQSEGEGSGLAGITATLGTGRGAVVGTGVIALSLLLAWGTHRYVETPLRQKGKPERSWMLWDRRYWASLLRSRAKIVTVAVLVVASAVVLSSERLVQMGTVRPTLVAGVDGPESEDYPGPRAFLEDMPAPDGVDVQPAPVYEPATMLPEISLDGCLVGVEGEDLILTHDKGDSEVPCAYGDTGADRTMYLAGGSHSEHFLPALDAIGQERGIRIVPLVKMGCVLGMKIERMGGGDYEECYTWQQKAQDYILDNPPTDGVFMTSTRPTARTGAGPDQVPDGYVDTVRTFTEAGIHTWGVRDNPWRQSDGTLGNSLLCVADGGDPDECGPSAGELLERNPALDAYRGLDITHIDLTAAYCRDGICPAVVGNVLVYRDGNHFTPTWVTMMGPELERQMYEPDSAEEQQRAAAAAVRTTDGTGNGATAPALAPKDVYRLPKPEPAPEPAPDPAPPVVVEPGWVEPEYLVDPAWIEPAYAPPY
ncbi:Putative membrane protein [Corynebacterium glyciniphilum AJ 3170]|uniref:Putative membrane protein n=1 Tax=Corynebacterium glyciniphilum AJ 3170 TaxID=1404245 RepID=X5DPU6_9CORY|nr:acyltransferase family protein [Corynebacterium glyciniphilum]AHW62687.1 Putative membrane protein [Corynebacterium glyciniphilum AJ 3170]